MEAGPLPAAVAEALRAFEFPVALAIVDADGSTRAGGNTQSIYPWMSVTKLLTARIVLEAVDAGKLDLDDEVADGVTVEEALAHAGGLGPDGERICAPRTRRIYSNAGYERLGEAASSVLGRPIADLLTGYMVELGALVDYTTSPAWGLSGDLSSLARLTRELAWPTRIDRGLDAVATRPAWPGLPGVLPGYGRHDDNLWGLGPEIKGEKRPHWMGVDQSASAFGHFGQSGSFVWIDRSIGRAACFLGAEPFGETHRRLWPGLNGLVAEC